MAMNLPVILMLLEALGWSTITRIKHFTLSSGHFSCVSLPPPLTATTQALTDQAVQAIDNKAAAFLPPSSQRRLVRILRELDPNAVRKLLLWESVMKEGAEGDDPRRANRLKMRVQAEIKALDKEAVSLTV